MRHLRLLALLAVCALSMTACKQEKQLKVLYWNVQNGMWPIPADQRQITGGALSQNPGWVDGITM